MKGENDSKGGDKATIADNEASECVNSRQVCLLIMPVVVYCGCRVLEVKQA